MNLSCSKILERVNDGFVALDAQWRFTYVNRRAGDLLGRSPQSLIGKNVWAEFPAAADQSWAHACRRALQEQAPLQLEIYCEARDRWFENRFFPGPEGLSIFCTDVTERKRAEATLQDSEQRFRTLVETSPEPIGIAVEGRTAYANPAMLRLLGASSLEEILDKPAIDRAHPEDRERIRQRIRIMLEGKQVEPDLQRWIRLDGQEIWVETVSSPTTYQGRPAHQTLARDVTEQVLAKERLRRQEAYFRSLTEYSADLITVLEADGTIRYQNAAVLHVTGYSDEELAGTNVLELVHPEDLPAVRDWLLQLTETPETMISACFRLRHRDHSWRHIESQGRSLLHDPSVQGVVVNSRDATERIRTEEKLRESGQRLSLALSGSGQGMWDWNVATGEVHFSPEWARMLGYEPEEVGHVPQSWKERLHPDDRERVTSALRAHLDGLNPLYESEYRLRHREGHWIWVLDRGRVVHRDAQGKPTRTTGLMTDISARKRAEEKLRASEERYRLVMRATSDVLWDYDLVTGRVYWGESLAGTFGYEVTEEDPQLGWWEGHLHPDDRARVLAGLENALHDEQLTWSDEYRFRCRDGRYAIVYDRGLIHRDEQQRPVRMIGSMQDVTSQRAVEAELGALFSAMQDVILVMDRDGRYQKIAPTNPDLLFRPCEELIGRTFHEVLPPEQADFFVNSVRATLDQNRPISIEYSMEISGRELWFAATLSPMTRDTVVWIARDVTERRRAEEAIRASERRYREIFEQSRDPIYIRQLDGSLVDVNPAAEECFGAAREELLKHNVQEFYANPADRERIQREVSIHGSIRNFEVRLRRLNGSEFDALVSTTARYSDDGEIVGYQGTVHDITELRSAEESRRASQRRYREIFEHSRDVIYVTGADGAIVEINPAAEEVFGAPREELLRHSVFDLYADPAQRERLRQDLHEIGPVRDHELRLRRLDGGEFDALVSTTVLRSEGGQVIGYQGTIHDITERKDVERRLRAQEARFRSLIENVHDIITVLDPHGTIRYISPSVERALGRPVEAYLDTSAIHWIHPDDHAETSAAVSEDLARPGAGRTMQMRARHQDGTWRRLEMVSLNLLHDPDVQGMIFTARDVTERSEAEDALQRSEAWFRSLTQNALDITTVLDADGRIRYATPSGARTLGYDRNDLRGRTLLDLIHPEDQPQVSAALAHLVTGSAEPISITARIRAHDDTWQVHQSVAQSLLHDPSVHGIVINSRDVTEQRRLEAQLRQAQKMEAVGRLAGGVAHDFNNVLMAITGFAALLESELPSDGEAAQYLSEIHKSADRAASLTRQLLAFGRKQALRPKVVNLNSIVEGAGAMLRRLVREDIQLVYRLDTALGQCRVDPHQVEQVLMNLVVNATDALPDGGVIELATANRILTERDRRLHPYLQPGRYTAVSVRDTGHGMDAEIVAKIFEPFFTTKELGKGTGLGLSTVYGIVKQSGGYIVVDSRPGEGSTFTVLFPRIAAEESARGLRTRSPLRQGSGTILLAEDEDAVRLLARLTLQKAGYTVLEARDGDEALRIAQEHQGQIDLLLTDVVMPLLGGYALARRLREQRPSLRVVFMSGYPGNAVREVAPSAGEADFVPKPITPEVLTHRVEEALTAASSTPSPLN